MPLMFFSILAGCQQKYHWKEIFENCCSNIFKARCL